MQNFLVCTKNLLFDYIFFLLLFAVSFIVWMQSRKEKKKRNNIVSAIRSQKKKRITFLFRFRCVNARGTVCMCVLINCNKHIVSIDVACFFSLSLSHFFLLHCIICYIYVYTIRCWFFHSRRSFAIEYLLLLGQFKYCHLFETSWTMKREREKKETT